MDEVIGVTYAHGMNDCKAHLDICIYRSMEKKGEPTKVCINV
jgi:hypothetical protein